MIFLFFDHWLFRSSQDTLYIFFIFIDSIKSKLSFQLICLKIAALWREYILGSVFFNLPEFFYIIHIRNASEGKINYCIDCIFDESTYRLPLFDSSKYLCRNFWTIWECLWNLLPSDSKFLLVFSMKCFMLQ